MSRTIRVAKLGEEYTAIAVDGAITYRALLQMAGFSGSEAAMAQGVGPVNSDEPVGDTVTAVVVSMPKFSGGAGIPAGLRVVDENGNEWQPVASATASFDNTEAVDDIDDDDGWEDDDDDDFNDDVDDIDEDVDASVRMINVAQLGKPYTAVAVYGAITYRTLIQMAGYTSADGVFVNGIGAVNLDEPVMPEITSVVVSMPKFAGGFHQ